VARVVVIINIFFQYIFFSSLRHAQRYSPGKAAMSASQSAELT